MPATFNLNGSFPLQGQDDESETLLPTASRLRFVKVPNAELDYVKKRLMCHLDTQNSLEPLQILGCGNIF